MLFVYPQEKVKALSIKLKAESLLLPTELELILQFMGEYLMLLQKGCYLNYLSVPVLNSTRKGLSLMSFVFLKEPPTTN